MPSSTSKESQPLTVSTSDLYNTTDHNHNSKTERSSNTNAVVNHRDGDENPNAVMSTEESSSASYHSQSQQQHQAVLYQYEIVDAAGLVAGSKESDEHNNLVERVAQVDFLHKLFFYMSFPSLLIALVVAIVLYNLDTIEANVATKGVAVTCTVLTFFLSLFLIYCHLTAYTNPPQQRLICRILLMAPVYSIDSTIGLFAYKEGSLAAVVRDTYEAYVIYMFYRLLFDYLGSEERVLSLWAEFKPEGIDHIFPMNIIFWFDKCPLNARTLNYIKISLVQYMIIRPLLTLITIPLHFTGYYHEGDFSPSGNAYLYFAIIQNVSVFFAFSALVYFYFACKEFLEPYAPGMKFIVVKAVVFCCFWQGIVIAIIAHFGVIPHSQFWTSEDVAVGLQNFLVVVEMYIVAIAHRWVFTDTPYIPVDGRMTLRKWQVLHVFSISDVVDEAKHAVINTPNVIAEHAMEYHQERKEKKEREKSMANLAKNDGEEGDNNDDKGEEAITINGDAGGKANSNSSNKKKKTKAAQRGQAIDSSLLSSESETDRPIGD